MVKPMARISHLLVLLMMGVLLPGSALRADLLPPEHPNLYVLAIGISKFKNPQYNLQFAAKDAQDFAVLWKTQAGKLYHTVNVKVLTDEEATRANILDALDWLGNHATGDARSVIFWSGHALTDQQAQFWLPPYEFDLDRTRATGVAWNDLAAVIHKLPTIPFVFLDTVHSASVMHGFGSSGMTPVIFASCLPQEKSLESPEWGHGLFSKAVIEGLGGKAANAKGDITLASLSNYVSQQVTELSANHQHPCSSHPATIPDSFVLFNTGGQAAPAVENHSTAGAPVIRILAPAAGTTLAAPEVVVRARVTDPRGHKIRSVMLIVNGREVGRMLLKNALWQETATLVNGQNVLVVRASNDAGLEGEERLSLSYVPK